MSDKGYMVIEKIPDKCSECDLGLYTENYTTGACLANKFAIVHGKSNDRPDWCPIKEFPEEDNENYFPDEFLDGMATGWNMCLKKIKGEEMNF